jgi:copper transport protein
LIDGTYTVAWRTVSAVDGHVAAGSFAFGVGVAPSVPSNGGAAQTTSPSASIPAVGARWFVYLGLVVMLGAAFVGFAIDPRAPRSVARLVGAGWLAAAVGMIGVIAVQWADAGADWSTLVRTSIGLGAIERVASLVIGGLVVVGLVATKDTPPRWMFGLATALALGAVLVDVLNGHAAATRSVVDMAVQWLHAVSAGSWIGGLAALLLATRGAPNEAKAVVVRRFSAWAGVAIALVAVTGVLRAISEVQSIDALVSTDFGRLVYVKTGLLVVLALLGATNRFLNVPAAVRSLRGLRRVGSTEVVVGTIVLAVTGLLVNVAPPSSVGAVTAFPPPTSVVASGNDFGTSVRVRLVVSPGAPGANQFSAAVVDYDSGAPSPASGVKLRFELASRSGVGTSTLDLVASGTGTYEGSGANLAIDGIWKVTATITGSDGAVEVPLALATGVADQHVGTIATPGAPTIQTVHLDAGNSVQLYLDPGRAGTNDLHATFFDAAGAELPVQSATFVASPSGGSGTISAGRELEPGHFITNVSAPPGGLAVDVVGPNPAGGQLHAHLSMQVQS